MEDIYIQLENQQYDESLSKIRVLFILKRFPQSFPAVSLFLLMFQYKKTEKGPLTRNYFILMKISLFIQFLIWFQVIYVS